MCGCLVKALSAWLTYIGSFPLTSHEDSSLKKIQASTYTHSIIQYALFIDALHSSSFILSSPLHLFPLLVSVQLGTGSVCSKKEKKKKCYMWTDTKRDIKTHTVPYVMEP